MRLRSDVFLLGGKEYLFYQSHDLICGHKYKPKQTRNQATRRSEQRKFPNKTFELKIEQQFGEKSPSSNQDSFLIPYSCLIPIIPSLNQPIIQPTSKWNGICSIRATIC